MNSYFFMADKASSMRTLEPARYAMYYEFETRGVFSGYTASHFGPSSAKHMKEPLEPRRGEELALHS